MDMSLGNVARSASKTRSPRRASSRPSVLPAHLVPIVHGVLRTSSARLVEPCWTCSRGRRLECRRADQAADLGPIRREEFLTSPLLGHDVFRVFFPGCEGVE